MTPEQRTKSLLDEFSDLHGAMCTVMENLEEVLTEWIQITPEWGGAQSMFIYGIREVEGYLEDVRADLIDVSTGSQVATVPYDKIASYENDVLMNSSYEWKKVSSIASDTTEDPYEESRTTADPTSVSQNRERLHQIFGQWIELSDVFYKQKKGWQIKINVIKDPDHHTIAQDIFLLYQHIWRKTGELQDILILGKF